MKDRAMTLALFCAIPLAIGWLAYRELRRDRRTVPTQRFHGTYEQPVEPWGDVVRVPSISETVH